MPELTADFTLYFVCVRVCVCDCGRLHLQDAVPVTGDGAVNVQHVVLGVHPPHLDGRAKQIGQDWINEGAKNKQAEGRNRPRLDRRSPLVREP